MSTGCSPKGNSFNWSRRSFRRPIWIVISFSGLDASADLGLQPIATILLRKRSSGLFGMSRVFWSLAFDMQPTATAVRNESSQHPTSNIFSGEGFSAEHPLSNLLSNVPRSSGTLSSMRNRKLDLSSLAKARKGCWSYKHH
jgi:hypothetical protein